MDTLLQLVTLSIIITCTQCNEWPSEYPELDTDFLSDELCPWDAVKQCYIFSRDKEIDHPVLNGMIDCDNKHFDKNLNLIQSHYGRKLYKYKTCQIQDIFRILCKKAPDDRKEMKEYAVLSRFYFLPKTLLSTARSSKTFNNLANNLATSRLIFNAIGLDQSGSTMSDFENVPNKFQNYMDYFYREMYISASSWNMNRDDTKYADIKQVLDIMLSSSDLQQIIIEGRQLYFAAFDCDFIGCKAINPNILYYDEMNTKLSLNMELERGCLRRKHKCSQSRFEKEQSVIKTWSPANFGFVEIESAFRIKYGDHWMLHQIPNAYQPKEPLLSAKKYINNGMEIKSSSVITPFEWKRNSEFSYGAGAFGKHSKHFGFVADPLQNLESEQRIKFMGKVRETTIFHIKGKKERNLQIAKKHEKSHMITPIFPPLSQIQITWILYNWRFCWIKQFGADKAIKLYAEPPDIIQFTQLTQDTSTAIWEIEGHSALHDHKFVMATFSEIRLYPNCGESGGKTTDNKNPCDYVYFYDASRIQYNEIEQWNGYKFSPNIDEEYKYLLLKYDKKKTFELGMIINPLLGKNATININFDLETNDWKNIYLLPFKTEIETKLLFSQNNNAPIQLIAPKLTSTDKKRPIAMGNQHCFKIKLKSISTLFSDSAKSISTAMFSDIIYLKPIIFPTQITIKKWKKRGYEFDDCCSAGFTLLSINEEKKEVSQPGLMHFTFSDVNAKSIKFGSFCVYFKLYGKYNIFYEIGSKHWYQRDNHLISFGGTLEALVPGIQNEINSNQQLAELETLDINKCYSESNALTNNKYFKEKSYLKHKTKFLPIMAQYIVVEKPGAVSFEIRQFPEPLKIGGTTDWIKIYVSRKPFKGEFVIKPICKTEKKLKFQFEKNANDFYELEPYETGKKTTGIEPFSFKIKITAPKVLQCFGHFPYKIDWIIKERVAITESTTFNNDDINNPPSIYLMVIANDFDDKTFDVHDTANHKNGNVYDDGMADPKCIEKYNQRKEDELDLGPSGPNGQLAPPLNGMDKQLQTGYMAEGGEANDVQQFLKPVTVSNTIRNPAQLTDYLKDYERLKKYVCDNQPSHEVCGVNATSEQSELYNENNPSNSPTIAATPPLQIWAWQNIVIYVACMVIVIGIVKALGCWEKSLETKIIEAQMRAM